MADPIPNELEMVEKLKERFETHQSVIKLTIREDGEHINGLFLRFLRARDLNLNKAEEMLTKHFEWIEQNEIESIGEWIPTLPLCREEYPYEITGVDKQGCPVAFGQWDVKRLCDQGMKSDYIRWVDQLFYRVIEAMRTSSAITGRNISQFVMIMIPDDLSAFRQMSSRQAVDAVLETVRRFEANHPETLKCAFVVDTPKVFQLIFSVVRPLLNSKTLGKVTIAGGSREWRSTLWDLIEPQNLPPRLGGSYVSKYPVLNKLRVRTPPSSLQRSPGDVSSSAFFSRTVPPGRSLSIEYSIPAPRTQLSWAFKTEKWDIGFSILYDATEIVLPFSRVASDEQLQCGSILCHHSGKYVLVFDNTFSRWRSKVVLYRVVLRPQQDDIVVALPNNNNAARRMIAHGINDNNYDHDHEAVNDDDDQDSSASDDQGNDVNLDRDDAKEEDSKLQHQTTSNQKTSELELDPDLLIGFDMENWSGMDAGEGVIFTIT